MQVPATLFCPPQRTTANRVKSGNSATNKPYKVADYENSCLGVLRRFVWTSAHGTPDSGLGVPGEYSSERDLATREDTGDGGSCGLGVCVCVCVYISAHDPALRFAPVSVSVSLSAVHVSGGEGVFNGVTSLKRSKTLVQ